MTVDKTVASILGLPSILIVAIAMQKRHKAWRGCEWPMKTKLDDGKVVGAKCASAAGTALSGALTINTSCHNPKQATATITEP